MSSLEQAPWLSPMARLRAAQLEIMRRAPYRDFGLIPSAGAAEVSLQAVETRLGLRLPEAYRNFLSHHDGWIRCYDGASLLGCHGLGQPEHQSLAKQLFCSAAAPSAHTAGSYRPQPQQLLVFGVDPAGTTLFSFDLSASRIEPPVTAWIGELGLRFASFCDFLRGIARLCEAELAELESSDLAAPASAPRRRDSAVILSGGTEHLGQQPVDQEVQTEAAPTAGLSELPLERTG
jgi:hypothetical protein